MADAKLSALTELAATPATDDELYIRDVSELAVDESKRITVANLVAAGVTSVTGTAPIASSGGATPAISLNDAGVTLAKMADVATARFVGRTTAGTGVPEALTAAQATALLDAATATVKGLVPTPPNNTTTFLRGDATFAAPAGGGADQVVAAYPGNGFMNGASVSRHAYAEPIVAFGNNVDIDWDVMVKVPLGATSISSIRIFYIGYSTGNLRLKFITRHESADVVVAAESDATDLVTTYVGDNAGNNMAPLTVPAGAYNALTSIQADDMIGLDIFRDGDAAADTYEQTFAIVVVEFTFA